MASNICTRGTHAVGRLILAAAMAALSACGGGGESGIESAGMAQLAAAAPASSAAQAQSAPSTSVAGPGLVGQQPRVVNTTTAGQQLVQAIGPLADGGYTVAWLSENASGVGAARNLYMRRYDASGAPASDEILVPFDLGIDGNPAIAVLADGSLVVAYTSKRPVESTLGFQLESSGIYTQRFDAAGAPVGGETTVYSLVRDLVFAREVDSAINPSIVTWPDGSYLVGWYLQHDRGVYGKFSDFRTQRYDATGSPVGTATLFTGRGDPTASFKLLAVDDGGYVESSTYSFMGLQYVIFEVLDSAGQSMGTIGSLYDANTGLPAAETVLLPLRNGEGFALWSRNQDGSYFQRLDSSGHPVGAPVPTSPLPVAATALADGGYVAFWQASGSTFVTAQRYDSSDIAVGAPFQIDVAGASPLVAALADAGFAFAWSAVSSPGNLDVFTQLFLEPEATGPVRQAKRRACLAQAKAQQLTGKGRRQFMTACMA